ncbi:MAG: SCO family protein [Chthoniobacterales bacterium]
MTRLHYIFASLLFFSCAFAEEAKKESQLADGSVYALTSEWTDQNGDSLKWQSLNDGKSRIVAMGYATCKGICPRLIAEMQRVENALTDEEKDSVEFVFLSVAPEQDGVKELKALADSHRMSERWRVLTGDPDGVLEMAVVLGVQFTKLPDGVNYSHSFLIATLDKDGVITHRWKTPEEGPEPSVTALRKKKS